MFWGEKIKAFDNWNMENINNNDQFENIKLFKQVMICSTANKVLKI